MRMIVWLITPIVGALLSASLASGSPAEPIHGPDSLSAADWSSILRAHTADLYRVNTTENGEHQASNPGQCWSTRFDGRGFSTRPETGRWSWGLELLRYGRRGHAHLLGHPKRVRMGATSVAYDWDATLTEWYRNEPRGLEHGYTIRRPPLDGSTGAEAANTKRLVFTLAVRGGLEPRVTADGRGVRFVDPAAGAVLSYTGLVARDAQGQNLPARFELVPEGLLLSADVRGARYPVTIDPLAQQAYLKASNTGFGDLMGSSVAISGDTVVVGAPSESSNATGVNGNQSDDSISASGAAYVFVRSGTGWSQQAYLKASNTDYLDSFGAAVAISGDTIVVGAPAESSNATGVNGAQSNNLALFSGAAYVFVRNGTTWSQQAYLKASNTEANDDFGSSVGVSGETIVVGAYAEDSSALGVNGNQADNGAPTSGAAYVFVRNGTTWSQQAYLKASNTDPGDHFGRSVAVSSETVLVGAELEASLATGVNGNQADNSGFNAGAVYVFARSGSSWSQQAYLKASNTDSGDGFGFTIALSGDTAVVGAIWESSNATGVNGNQTDNSASLAGAAYVFARSGSVWSQQAYLKASNAEWGDGFGGSVAVSGDLVLVGALWESGGSGGVNGDQADNSVYQSGAAYAFLRSGTSWVQQAYLKASYPGSRYNFGRSVAASGNTLVCGSPGESSGATGVNGNANDNSVGGSGAAFVFLSSAWSDEGSALAGVAGDPLLLGAGSLAGGSSNRVDLSNAAPNATAALFLALSSTPVPFKGGLLMPYPALMTIPVPTSALGTVEIPFVAGPLPSGTTLWVQWAIIDATAIQGVALSNATQGLVP